MSLDEQLKRMESECDAHCKALQLWEIPFQSVISQLLLAVEVIDYQGRTDTAMDYSGRLSYIYPYVADYAQKTPLTSTTESIVNHMNPKYVDDINFLIAYAHLSMLMPQYHRKLYRLTSLAGNHIRLEYKDQAASDAEIIDRVLSYVSLQMVVPYKDVDELKAYLKEKVEKRETGMAGSDFYFVMQIKEFLQKYTFNIKVVPDAVFEDVFGITYQEYYSFIATVRAFAEFFIQLGRTYHEQIDREHPKAGDGDLESEYMEWTACCMSKNTLGWFMQLSGLSLEKLKRVFGFYYLKYSDTTTDGFSSEAWCGDGYFPPFIWFDDHLLFSPHACKYMLTVNNMLYSMNKNKEHEFADRISHHLEPCLINQLEYIFQIIPGIQIRKNVDYKTSEIDLIVYSPSEKVALCFQVKATIAPDSARTVRRVEQRALEGIDQIRKFEALSVDEQEHIIRGNFGNADQDISFQHFLTIRSCAGSFEIWQHNPQYPITNYTLLAHLLVEKAKNKRFGLANFKQEVLATQREFVRLAKPEIAEETLVIRNDQITFPDVSTEPGFMAKIFINILTVFPDFEYKS